MPEISNEELQSMNEELETAKEELQSVNEELTTLNDELRCRNDEVSQVNSDLLNFALTVDIAIVTLDLKRRIRRFTPKARSLFNIQPSDVGRAIDDIELNIDVSDLSLQIAGVLETRIVNEREVKDRNGHWYRMQIRPYEAAHHRIDGVLVSFVDIHRLKQLVGEADAARSEAERANRAKDDFLATLSHELRTPLSSMSLNVQRLRRADPTDRASLQRTSDSLERATWAQTELIDALLDVSRIVSGKLELDCRALDLCSSVRAQVDELRPLYEAKSLEVTLVLESAVSMIFADAARVKQVVSNLLANAIKFTPARGHVTIVIDAVPDFARLRVTDTGIGIAADFLPRLFTRFSQSDSSITRQHGGLGLGLALVRQLVELHGGTAEAQSAGVGQGASFVVTFPRLHARVKIEDHSVSAASPGLHALDRPGRARNYDALAGLRVLFIDDDERTREAIFEVLQLAGARVELSASAAEGIAALERFEPQVIMCDIAMPGEDGYSFIRKLRAREAGKAVTIPALALTALASADDKRRALEAGFQLHMAKPIDIDRLRDAVLELSQWTPPSGMPTQAPPVL